MISIIVGKMTYNPKTIISIKAVLNSILSLVSGSEIVEIMDMLPSPQKIIFGFKNGTFIYKGINSS